MSPTICSPTLPPPQRSALARALLVDTDDPGITDPRAVSVALLNCLRRLASEQPVLLAVDDVQWLDAGSATALTYAIRRLETEPVALLLGRRLGMRRPSWSGSSSSGSSSTLCRWVRLHCLLHERHGSSLSRAALHRLYERSGGNPFFASSGPATAHTELDAVRHPGADRETARRAARDDRRDDWRVVGARAFEPGTPAGVDRCRPLRHCLGSRGRRRRPFRDGLVVFAHPLFASVAYERQEDDNRRALHQRAANLLAEPEARARNLARRSTRLTSWSRSSASSPRCTRPGAAHPAQPQPSTSSRSASASHTRPTGARLAAAHEHARASEIEEATSLLELLIVELPPGPHRAAALTELSDIEEDLDRQAALLKQAIGEAEGLPALVGKTTRELAMTCAFAGDLGAALDHLDDALAVFGDTDSGELALTIGSIAALGLFAGRPRPEALIERLHRVQSSIDLPRWDRVEAVEAFRSSMLGRPRAARATYELFPREIRDTGDERRLEHALRHLTYLAISEGDVAEADRLLPEHARLVALAGRPTRGAYIEALVHADAGRVEPARLSIGELRAAATAGRDFYFTAQADSLEGFLELERARPRSGVAAPRPAHGSLRVARLQGNRLAADALRECNRDGRRGPASSNAQPS